MKSALHPDIQRQLVGGADLLQEVERVAAYLAGIMQEIHGDTWDIAIDHHAGCFISISRNFSAAAPVEKSNNGGN